MSLSCTLANVLKKGIACQGEVGWGLCRSHGCYGNHKGLIVTQRWSNKQSPGETTKTNLLCKKKSSKEHFKFAKKNIIGREAKRID